MAQGRTNAGIEQSLYLSSSTVEKHVNSIFSKLRLPATGVHRRVAAVLAFLQRNGNEASDRFQERELSKGPKCTFAL